ncbi:MAG: ABC transporter substrate-binding protein [Propionibacteriaceae bacterium]|nr:ABC transporter substrate-binding protein [Micropruina sp.]HBX82359.1 ABC transporter substrate-binding protein [Propionibacteriaceae bacterium]HBY22535.1 ABC transporter substrate-binding protein [Propionibacteriaceae bacterium]
MRNRLITGVLASALCSIVTLTACSAPAGTSTSAAGTTDSLNIACSQQEDFCQKITAAFQKATGIKSTYVRLGSGEVLARLQTATGEFDVWSGGQAENHLIANDKGFVTPYVSPNAAALTAEFKDDKGIWAGFYTDSIAFCSNSKELAKLGIAAPTSWQALLDPKLKGHIAMPHPATAGVGYMAIFTVDALNNGDKTKTIDYFKSLNPSIVQYSKSAATGTEMAGRGEVAIAIALDSDCVKAKLSGFADLVNSYPAEGTGYEVGSVSILKGARNEAAAKKYMDWILSTDAQNQYADVPSYAAPTLPKATVGKDVPPQTTLKKVPWDLRKAADGRADFIKAFESDVAASSTAK